MVRRGLGILLLLTTSMGCAHQVKIASNVPEAQVRVDGERLGAIKDGAVFTERGGIGATYDIEVIADGYITRRQIVKPSEIDPWVGIPTVGLAVGSCCLAGCAAPVFGLVAATSEEVDTQIVGFSLAGGLVGMAVGAIAVAAWGVERLPDVVTFDLAAVGEEPVAPLPATSVPTPVTPKDEKKEETAPPTPPTAPTPEATSTTPTTTPTPSTPNTPTVPSTTSPPPKTTPAPTPKAPGSGGSMGY